MKTNILLFLIVLLMVSGCSAKWHLKQSLRHERIAIQKGAVVQVDTVWQDRAVYVKETVKDTVFSSVEGDTVLITQEKLQIKYVKLPGEKVYIEGKCKADTVVLKVPVKVEKVIYAPQKGLKWWQFVLIGAGAMLVLFFVIRK